MLSTDSSSYLQINTPAHLKMGIQENTLLYKGLAQHHINTLQMRLPHTPHSSISYPKFIPQHSPKNVAVFYNDLNVNNIFFLRLGHENVLLYKFYTI